MPLYEFKCNDCGKVIEIFTKGWFKIGESYTDVCPKCKGKLMRLPATPSIRVQWSRNRGFYKGS